MGKTSPRQLSLNFERRRRSRRKRLSSNAVPHRRRPEHKGRNPVHVTLRGAWGLPSLREQVIFFEMRRALGRSARSWFHIVHFSVQADHVHLLVEASDKASLSRGIMGVAIRMARAVNRVLKRHGNVWSERYHSRALKTPREVRNGIVYVLMNKQKHSSKTMGLDPCSSASLFDGWKVPPSVAPPRETSERNPVEPPATWLLRSGWRRHGLIGRDERPKHADRGRGAVT
jgi:REP-associated tyrosine transposase